MEKHVEIPFQIENLIAQMLNKNDNVHIRGNFRIRLTQIREAIDTAISKYDSELNVVPFRQKAKRK